MRRFTGRIRMVLAVVLILAAGLAFGTEALGAEQQTEEEQGDVREELLGELELDQVQKMLDGLLGEDSFSFKEGLKKLIYGEEAISKETVGEFLHSLFFSELDRDRGMFVKLLFLVLMAAVIANFASVFDNGQVGEMGFYVVYLLLFMLLMDAFYETGGSLYETISWMAEFMKALAPSYFMTVAASSGGVTAAVFYEGVLLLAWFLQWVLVNLILPAADLYVLLKLVNHLSKEEMLGKFAELLDTVIGWTLKTLLGVVTGLQIVRSLVAPVMDSLKRGLLGKAAGALPGVGNAVNMVTELVITSAVLVRNCLGVMILLAFVAAGAGPVIRYGILSLAYRFLAAVVQPVSDKRVVECLSTMGQGFALLLKILFTAEVLCILTFLIIMAGIQGGGP